MNMLEQEMNDKAQAVASQSQLAVGDIDKERAEVEGQIQRYQSELESKTKELKAIYQVIEESSSDSHLSPGNTVNEVVINQLRAKILEIQDLSFKMDELQSKNDELELQARKIESYDKQLYDESRRNKTVQQLMREI